MELPALTLSQEDQQILYDAAAGNRNATQKRIAEIGLAWTVLLLKKNQDYGDSVHRSPCLKPSLAPLDAILVRMSDKVSRIAQLSGGEQALVAESLEDSMRDLGAYCLLYCCQPK